MEISMEAPQKSKNRLTYDLTIPLRQIFKKYKPLNIPMFTVALFAINKL
jgi:hypothetical protein